MRYHSLAWMLGVTLFAIGCDKSNTPHNQDPAAKPLPATVATNAQPAAPTSPAVKAPEANAPEAKAPEAKAPEVKTPDPTKAASTPAATDADKTAGEATSNVAKFDLKADPLQFANEKNQPGDWPQWCGSSLRNNTPEGKNIPTEWDIGKFDDATGEWVKGSGKNIKWVARLGSQSYGNPVIANGRIVVGTNNGKGWLKRYPATVDLGCLLCFNQKDGAFLWQDSSEKLPQGRVVDWPDQGICCSACVEGDRLWYVSSRGEVKCLALNGNLEAAGSKNDDEEAKEKQKEAKVLWSVNMMKEWRISQHNMCSCSVTIAGDTLFVNTSNGVDEGHINLPQPHAPSFAAINKNTGKVYWMDGTPGENVLHGQWSSPSFAVIDGVPQVIFGAGDGWVYGFDARGDGEGKSKILWKFDANPKTSKYVLGGRANRNHIICTPVIHDNKVYVAVGEDPEHAEGVGHLYGIDPTKRGDISLELAVKRDDPTKTPIPIRRNQAVIEAEGEVAIPNPNAGALWHYAAIDRNDNGKIEFEETMHRTVGTPAIKSGLLYIADFSGLFHCLDAKTGKVHWVFDMKAETWGSPLIVEDKVYIGTTDGVILVFRHSDKMEKIAENSMGGSVYGSPIIANNILYINSQNYLFAIEAAAK